MTDGDSCCIAVAAKNIFSVTLLPSPLSLETSLSFPLLSSRLCHFIRLLPSPSRLFDHRTSLSLSLPLSSPLYTLSFRFNPSSVTILFVSRRSYPRFASELR